MGICMVRIRVEDRDRVGHKFHVRGRVWARVRARVILVLSLGSGLY